MARATEAQGLVSTAIELTGDDGDLRAHARFVAGEVAWMSGDTAAAMRTWGDILTQHKTTPTPSGTCRAALGLAKAARQMGKHAEEQAAYRVAVHTALELQQPLLVEQAFLGWGRALQDAGEEGIEERLLAKLGEARSRYPRLVDALDGGVLAELRTT